MFSQVSVVLFTKGDVSQHALGQTPPWADTPLGQTTPRADNFPPPAKATAADGTHPTGMHSCHLSICLSMYLNML